MKINRQTDRKKCTEIADQIKIETMTMTMTIKLPCSYNHRLARTFHLFSEKFNLKPPTQPPLNPAQPHLMDIICDNRDS